MVVEQPNDIQYIDHNIDTNHEPHLVFMSMGISHSQQPRHVDYETNTKGDTDSDPHNKEDSRVQKPECSHLARAP